MKRILNAKQRAAAVAAHERYRARWKAQLEGESGPPLLSRKGIPHKPLKPEQHKVLRVLDTEDRAKILRRIRQREWIAKKRRENPEKYRLAQLSYKRKRSLEGWYKRGGPWYQPPSEKRLAYFRRYNATKRKQVSV